MSDHVGVEQVSDHVGVEQVSDSCQLANSTKTDKNTKKNNRIIYYLGENGITSACVTSWLSSEAPVRTGISHESPADNRRTHLSLLKSSHTSSDFIHTWPSLE